MFKLKIHAHTEAIFSYMGLIKKKKKNGKSQYWPALALADRHQYTIVMI